MFEWRKSNDALGTVNRGVPCESGLCTLCRADCKGTCETWMSAVRGREMLYPRGFGDTTSGSGNVTSLGVGYHALRIQGYTHGAHGLPAGASRDPDDCFYMSVDLSTEFGRRHPVPCRLPLMTGALGSTRIAGQYWAPIAVGCALGGVPIVVGENVVGIDPKAELENGRIISAPEMDRRINTYRRYYDGVGAIIVQANVEDSRLGVPEYIIDRHGDEIILELKWGQGAKDIGGEIQVETIEQAKFLRARGYHLDPDPNDPKVEEAYAEHGVSAFARHSRLGGTDIDTVEQLAESFASTIKRLRDLGFKRITLKTGAYGMPGLALALRLAADHDIDLLTIDGAGGGTGMSPWNMMEQWGVPPLVLHAKAYEYCRILEARGIRPPDLSFAGGLAREDHIFKALAIGAPYTKLVCMGRSMMIPGFVGSNIEGVLHPDRRAEVNGHWEELPTAVARRGQRPEEIMAAWPIVKGMVGAAEVSKLPLGAVALFGYLDKLSCGLQQLMAGARKFKVSAIDRSDLMSANRETEEATGIPFLTDALDEEAKAILQA
jgi:hypothetical protein